MSGIITMTTDFGLSDHYVGVMKGVVLSINPKARLIDISHQVRPGYIFQAARLIKEAYLFFPKGTVHVAVVDPGVGGDRRPILVKTKGHFFVGPDNGLFWSVIEDNEVAEVIHLTEKAYFLTDVGHTFHGRDIFAPVASYLSRGTDPHKMGRVVNDPVPLDFPMPRETGGILAGEVVRMDHFGNLITNIHGDVLVGFLRGAPSLIRVGSLVVEGVRKTYAEAEEGEALALIGSSQYLEIAVNLGRACDRAGVSSGDVIRMKVEVNRA